MLLCRLHPAREVQQRMHTQLQQLGSTTEQNAALLQHCAAYDPQGAATRLEALLHAVRSDVLTRREAVALISEQPELLELDFGAVHEDEQLLLVHKPFQVRMSAPSRPAGADSPDEPSLHEWLVGTHPSVMTAAGTTRVCHNLDYATSGVVACAKSEGAAREVGRLFEARKARKLYAALVFGHPAWEERNISARIAVTARKFRQSVTKASSGKARPVFGMDEGGAGCSHKSTAPGPNRTIAQTRRHDSTDTQTR